MINHMAKIVISYVLGGDAQRTWIRRSVWGQDRGVLAKWAS